MRILVADDDAITRRIIQRVLESVGYEVSLAVDGLAALDSFKQSPPDIVITDFLEPDKKWNGVVPLDAGRDGRRRNLAPLKFAEFVEAARNVRHLDRRAIRERALAEWSLEAVAPRYTAWLERITQAVAGEGGFIPGLSGH